MLADTIAASVLYLLNLGFAAWAMWPDPINDEGDEDEDDDVPMTQPTRETNWEMQGMKSPMSARMTPYTPRTQAFHTLDRQLPLRQQATRFG